MRTLIAALSLVATATGALADTESVLNGHILPAVAQFSEVSAKLEHTARADCTARAMRPAYHTTFDAWMGISHLTFGPLETNGRMLSIAFWPDTRGAGPKALAQLIADQDAAIKDEADFAEVSVAARGLYALEHLLYGDAYSADSYTCGLVTAIAADLDRMATEIAEDWQDHADLMRSPGSAENATYLAEREVGQTVYTALMTGLEFTRDQRLGRPMGTFDRPRPNRAEARRSERSLRNVVLSLEALRELARRLAHTSIPESEKAFEDALDTAAKLDDPVFAGVETPVGRLKVEVLQQKVTGVREALASEIGVSMGLSQGFNSADGD